MNFTPRFSMAIKFSFLVFFVMFIYSFLLSYYGISGISISHPHENTDLRVALNWAKGILGTVSFWMLVGYLCEDFKAATLALVVSLALHYGIDMFYPRTHSAQPTKDLQFYLFSFLGILPYIIFGLVHFKSSIGLKLVLCWAIIWGLHLTLNTNGFERVVEGLTKIFGWRDPFEFHVPTGEGGYRPFSVLRILLRELFIIVEISIFAWVYQMIKRKQSIWDAMHTCGSTIDIDRLSFSAIYWSFRIMLFVAGLSLVFHIERTFSLPFDIITILRITAAAGGLVIAACLYRNFLVSHFVDRNKTPGGLFFWLNVPIVNFFAWLYSLIMFEVPKKEAINGVERVANFTDLKTKFVQANRNGGWKLVIILFTFFNLVYQLNRAGFRIDGPSRSGAFELLIISLISLALLLWYLYNKNAYLPLLILFLSNIILTAILRNESFLYPTMVSSIINIALYYGMFYFDELKWDDLDYDISKEDNAQVVI